MFALSTLCLTKLLLKNAAAAAAAAATKTTKTKKS